MRAAVDQRYRWVEDGWDSLSARPQAEVEVFSEEEVIGVKGPELAQQRGRRGEARTYRPADLDRLGRTERL